MTNAPLLYDLTKFKNSAHCTDQTTTRLTSRVANGSVRVCVPNFVLHSTVGLDCYPAVFVVTKSELSMFDVRCGVWEA